jgi:cytochrome c2
MKYYYLNKIAMAVLVALLLFFGTRTLINIAYEKHEPEEPGFEVAGGEEPEGEGEKPSGGGGDAAFIAALNKADPKKGEADVGLCKVCHTFEKGGATLVGPNLYGIVGTGIAEGRGGFNFTPALKKHEGQEWTFANLDHWLTNPQEFAPGTTMAFPGIPDLQKRADVVAYLNSNSDNPLPIPEPSAEEETPSGEAAGEEPEGEAAGQPEILTLIVAADPAQGEADAALCKVCHTFDKGGATLVGPNLYGVVGNKIASHEGFTYTPALKKHEGDTWTYENLDAWLTNPQAFASGTTMAFPGIPDAKKRADVIAYLRANDDNPEPLPEAAAPPAEEPAAEEPPAEEPAAEEPPAEEPAAEAPPAEEPAAEAPPAEEPAAEEPAAEEPAAEDTMEEETMDETIVSPPTVSEDAPSEPSMGEPPSDSQPQPVVPDELAAEPEEPSVTHEPAADEVMEEGREEIIINAPAVSEDAPSAPSTGEPPSASQPQPVYPDGEPEMKGTGSTGGAPVTDDGLSSQPQPVYPDGKPEGL